MSDFPTRFDFAAREPEIDRLWEETRAFTADPESGKPPFVIVIPPPNVTGSLHMGHALNNTLQDVLARWKRMDGHEALYLPGTDHAGIATQFKVEEDLWGREKKTRHDIGREALLRVTWQWKEKFEKRIWEQLRKLGCSCDWTRVRFTMDARYSRAVRFAFVNLFKRGLLYRALHPVNWCPSCQTALSDLELRREENVPGKLWYVRYALAGDPGKSVTVATTRPETILGDTAVAVHPKDERYKKLHGRRVVLPVIGREVPIVADDFVDPAFGSGAVKVTPAHDVADFECGKRNGLPAIFAFNERGLMTEHAGPFQGLDRFECRAKLVERLQADGLLEKVEDYTLPVLARCYRSDTIVEPYLSLQWFVRMAPLVEPAIEATKTGRVRFTPERFAKIYLEWLEKAHDWCVSRQIWWGHRIPVWTCAKCEIEICEMEDPPACPKCKGPLAQDENVLDTWFSSALWPFATLGWPEETVDLERFYPTSVLVTARDIIYLWVARMVMMGYEFRREEPYTDVVINPTVQTIEGKRMSKSLGTGVDPLDLIAEYGADALRFGMAVQMSGAQDLRFSPDRIEEARNFVTKVWNAARFVATSVPAESLRRGTPSDLAEEDRWIRSATATAAHHVTAALDRYEFGDACRAAYAFVWGEFCDWYIEMAKRRLKEPAVQATLAEVLVTALRLLHPVMPFVTEELWQRLREAGWDLPPVLARAEWPEPDAKAVNPALEIRMSTVFEAVRAVREIRNRMNIARTVALEARVDPRSDDVQLAVERGWPIIRHLANLSDLRVAGGVPKPPMSATVVTDRFSLYVPLEGQIDLDSERKRQAQRLAKVEGVMRGLEAKLRDGKFLENAPPEVVEAEKGRAVELAQQVAAIKDTLKDLE